MTQVLSRFVESWPASGTRRTTFDLVRTWLALWSERRALERLDERMLRDIGLDEGSARIEAGRPMWDVPAHRHPAAM